jgi:hypothetical protein
MWWEPLPVIVNEYGLFGSPEQVTVKEKTTVEPAGALFVIVIPPGLNEFVTVTVTVAAGWIVTVALGL